ncbi:MAG: NAD(P)H-dependent oxidoreductase [Flavobacteriales bacterium]|nr:NAD(P)H-dependent oxidoreductase [Flavobacteriales bacterium]MCB9190355.1 NAD(P)H-dependent oxidoreductase [Flavobacteriales bacterium]MCB9204595.1 NAD(P)H-dependent oxidoreductase [Flavobacteriales bacterium]
MKRILAISGSASENSSNEQLLSAIAKTFADRFQFEIYGQLSTMPLFTPARLKAGVPSAVSELKKLVLEADAVIISTPEYLHNIPAVLKNALEWMTESGELAEKPVLPIIFTPHAPRGQYAMISLLQSLKASKSKVVAELPLYQNQLRSQDGEIELDEDVCLMLSEALNLL